ncbi:TetR family transcriptional regulator C-terminal domain-containing protein [Micromonospora sp. WMMD998]|uniref:TetR/AcrR family transcriptional regulator n=1 Tax=Micromonospora sp. WMMD998 TaxID=3016092 RepID=UPI00249B26F9|nr:TetR family transcriptional regulator C-terminal domain-containing protein [Micromonospora sp. WMMD998]WFE38291.1 TetR family transcriptional regulator C-terminal domain-containing protein [Micromonospora sp. WMMD998]
MPKRVDHRERRALIADALMRVAAEQGLEAVSLRHVAAAAGVSAGMVQHYFRTRDEMMVFALAVVSERNEARVRRAVEALGPTPAPRALLRAMLAELLPLDEARQADGRVALAFLAYTAVRPAVAAALHDDTAALRAFVADQVAAGSPLATDGRVDPDRSAVALLAVMEGLGIHLLGGHYPPETALAALDVQLDLLFGPEPRPSPVSRAG